MLCSMIDDPLKKFFISHAAICNGQANGYNFIICTTKPNAVHFKERHHYIDANSLIAIYKGMI